MNALPELRALLADPRDTSSRAMDPHVLREHGPEPVRGLPEYLPPGERLLWQGAPSWRALATSAFHARALAAYFAVLAVWRVASGGGDAAALVGGAQLLGFGLLPIGLLALFAWATQRSTVYTITDRRLVMRIGIALPITLNLPFAVIEAAALRQGPAGTGDVVLSLASEHRVPWLVLWPHARPWRLARAEPALRAIPDAAGVAQLLARALAADAAMPVPGMPVPGMAVPGMAAAGADRPVYDPSAVAA